MLQNPRPQTSVTLAITPDALFAVQTRNDGGRLAIVKSGSEAVPPGCFTDGSVTDPQHLGRTIRTLWHRLGFKERAASVVLPSGLCALRAVRLPALSAPERRPVVRGELEHVGALPFRGGAFDFFWVEEATSGEVALAEAFALYTHDEVVTGIRSVLRYADLRLATLEPMSVGVLRACALAAPAEGAMAVLCLDDQAADFCILEAGQVRYLRRIPSGWADLQAPGAGAPDAPADATTAVPHVVPFLVTETLRSVAYYSRVRGSSPEPAQLVVPAVPADFNRLASIFHEAAVPPISAINPQSAFGVELLDPAQPPSTLPAQLLAAIGTGAAAVGLQTGIPTLDLAQDDPVTHVSNPWSAALPATVGASLVWLLLAFAGWSALTANADRAENDRQLLTGRTVEMRAKQAPLLLQEQLQERTRTLQATSNLPVAALLGQVASATDKEISVQNLSVGIDGSVTISGEALTADAVQRFSYALAMGVTLREPRIDTLKQDLPDRATFRIVGKIVPGTTLVKNTAGGS